jgi:hypothetical protein
MKRILLLVSMLIAAPLYASEDSYLRIKSYPTYPAPGQGVERSLEVSVNPTSPTDSQFSAIFNELVSISSDPKSSAVPLHERSITFEAKQNGKIVRVVYSMSNTKSNEPISKHWAKVFQLVREIANEQFNP